VAPVDLRIVLSDLRVSYCSSLVLLLLLVVVGVVQDLVDWLSLLLLVV